MQLGDQIRDLDVALMSQFDPALAGLYSLPARFTRPMNIIATATSTVAFSRFTRKPNPSRHSVLIAVILGSLPTLAIAGLVFGLAGFLPAVTSAQYASSVPVLRILCVGADFAGASMFLGTIMQAIDVALARRTGHIVLLAGVAQLVCASLAAAFSSALTAAVTVTAVHSISLALLAGSYWRHHRRLAGTLRNGEPEIVVSQR